MGYPNHPPRPGQGGWTAAAPGGATPPYDQGRPYGGAPNGDHAYGRPAHGHAPGAPQYGPAPVAAPYAPPPGGPQSYGGHPQHGAGPQPAPVPAPAPGLGPGQGQGTGQVVIDIKHHPLALAFHLMTPMITINGQPSSGRWGRNALPLPPGRHHVHIHLPYILPSRIGAAALTVPVQAGQSVELEYRAPMWAFSPGAFGPPPQPWNGMAALLLVVAIPFGLLFLMLLVGVLSELG